MRFHGVLARAIFNNTLHQGPRSANWKTEFCGSTLSAHCDPLKSAKNAGAASTVYFRLIFQVRHVCMYRYISVSQVRSLPYKSGGAVTRREESYSERGNVSALG